MRYFNNTVLSFILLFIALQSVPISIQAQSPVNKSTPGTFSSLLKKQKPASNAVSATAVGLQQFYSATGKYTLSADGIGSVSSSMKIRVNKPNAQATVEKAILISSVTFNQIENGCVTIAGTPVNWDDSATITPQTDFSFYNYWADVTSIVAPLINAFPAGISTLEITECNSSDIEGEALLVVFNDPTASEKTIVVMLGVQNPTGDNFSVTLAQAIDPNQSGALLDMGLGIGFGFQGSTQFSQVSVNDKRLTTSAGGQDDGEAANGALITVGGIGDANTNPADPFAEPTEPRSDDELYNILPFITNTTTSLNITTLNPSLDDNIFLAYFAISGAAVIGEGILLSQDNTSGNVGSEHTVTAKVVNDKGDPIANRLVTFKVISGPNAGNTFSATTNAGGEASYTYTGSGGAGIDSIQACFTNSENEVSCSNILAFEWVSGGIMVSSFTLINADNDEDIMELNDGDTINLAALPSLNLNIRANTNPAVVGSVVFKVSGQQSRNHTENHAPYALFANKGGDYFGFTPQPGDYTLTATPYSTANGGGEQGTPLTIHIHVLYQKVTSFTLVNAETDKDITILRSGDVIDLSTLPTSKLNIRANTNPAVVGSVVFKVSGQQSWNHTENHAPYALFANNGGDYFGYTPQPGDYTLTATPYSKANGGGHKGVAHTIVFSVVKGSATNQITTAVRPLQKPINEAFDAAKASLSASPNPVAGHSTISFSVPKSGYTTLQLYNLSGQAVERLYEAQTEVDKVYNVRFDRRQLPNGIYILRLATDKYVQTHKLVLIR